MDPIGLDGPMLSRIKEALHGWLRDHLIHVAWRLAMYAYHGKEIVCGFEQGGEVIQRGHIIGVTIDDNRGVVVTMVTDFSSMRKIPIHHLKKTDDPNVFYFDLAGPL